MQRAALALVAAACSGRSSVPPPVEGVSVTASDAAVSVDEDGAVAIVLSAAVDPSDAGPIGFTIEEEPLLGVLEGAGGSIVYTPDPDVHGEDGFTFTAHAGDAVSALARVTIHVAAVADAPSATPLQLGTDEDTAVSDRLPAVDVEGDVLAWVLVSAPGHGRVDLDPATGGFTYTPDRDWAGEDGFLWSASDPSGLGTGPARVDVVVAAVNDPPVVTPAVVLAAEDEVTAGVVGASDPDGDALALALVRDADHGTVALDTNTGAFTYTPDPDRYGPDSFEVTADDGTLASAPALVELVVASVNDPPVASDVQVLLDEDVPAAGAIAATDAEGDALTFSVLDPPAHGGFTLDGATGDLTYSPDPDWSGQDDALVRVADPFDAAPPVRVVLVVAPVNDPPAAVGGLLVTDEDVPVPGTVDGADPDGDVLVFTLARPPLHGTVQVDAASGDLVYTPDRDWSGVDDFGVVADDGAALSAEALVTVYVLPVNDPPLVPVASMSIVEDVPDTVSVATTDPEGDPLVYSVDLPPNHGTAVVDPLSGLVEYEPDPDYVGVDSTAIRVSDGQLDVVAVVPITVDPDADADGIADAVDVCPDVPDPLQGDENGNGVGDVCDCWYDPVTSPLDPELWDRTEQAVADTQYYFTPSYGLELTGDGAVVRTIEAPAGCASWTWSFELRTGDDPPESDDTLLFDARVDGGDWVHVELVDGTGAAIPWEHRSGDTVGLPLSGSTIDWRFFLVADSATDAFVIDEIEVGCDSDADGLPDCTEVAIPGYDLGVADADGDGWLDGDEYDAGSDPYVADTDGDGFDDPVDVCPVDWDPTQDPATCPPCTEIVVGYLVGWQSTHSTNQALWNSVEANALSYGTCPLRVVDIPRNSTLASVVATGADLLWLSDPGIISYSAAERQVVLDFVNLGHGGFVTTYLVTYYYDHTELYPLVGIDPAQVVANYVGFGTTVTVLDPAHPLAAGLPASFQFATLPYGSDPLTTWTAALLPGARIVYESADGLDVAVAYEHPNRMRGVMFSGLPEDAPGTNEAMHAIYNAAFWAGGY